MDSQPGVLSDAERETLSSGGGVGFDPTKTLRRERHLELLVFELLACLEELWDEEALQSTDAYKNCRILYKALAHGRRIDGTRY